MTVEQARKAGSGREVDPAASDGRPSPSHPVLEIPEESTSIPRLKRMATMLDALYTTVMQEGTDYDTIPGTSRPSLLKPGAELLARLYDLAADTRIVSSLESREQAVPYFQYDAECRLYNCRGEFVGNGVGSCNSAEPQYAFRWVFQEELPKDVKNPEELRIRDVGERVQYRISSSGSEVFGLVNSVRKKARKRAFVDAVISVTCASRMFTQDVGEGGDNDERGGGATTTKKKGGKPAC